MSDPATTLTADSPLDALVSGDGFLVLAPHPDDETLGCGALLAAAFANHGRAHVLVLTDGDKSHRNSASWPAERLGSVRRAEAIEAVRRLGGPRSSVQFLGFPDCEAPASGPAMEAAADRVRATMAQLGCRTLLVTSPADPHCDHQAAAAIARCVVKGDAGVRLLFYPIWSRQPGRDLGEGGRYRLHRFPAGGYASAKRRALMAHQSQLGTLISDDPHGFVLPRDFVETLLGEDEICMEETDAYRDD